MDAVGLRSTARQAARVSSSVTGCRANTDLPPRSTISPGATSLDAAQSMQRSSMNQSPFAELGLRASRFGISPPSLHLAHYRHGELRRQRGLPDRMEILA